MSREDFLPRLTVAPDFSESRASLDKIDLRFLDFILTGENAPTALNDMIGNAVFRHGGDGLNIFRHWSPPRRLLVDVASGRHSRTGLVPVFTGKLVGSAAHPSRVQFSLSAKLSVTRAILAQRLMRRIDKPAIGRGSYTLLIDRHSPTWQDEYPLVDATNVLIGPDLRYDYAMSQPASAHLVGLVTEIEEAIALPFAVAAQRHQVQGDVGGAYSLSEAEVYWEFDTPSPISTVDLLSSKLTSVVNRLCCTNRVMAEVPLSPDGLIPQLP
ncbi:hypothetical protein IQ03_03741 [Gemmobacter caeni]|uniref:Uncharacterized protein n=1 Tax=Gemmobacter caeni TaxID=589035 RepID=A0A2T6AS32_9RHOB|nr:hypothetical protein [Gemmobacter caeni]PTX46629.1 hypothetical protein C8N34_116106 [Gemmobacter caeni]TWI95478.1 hypothetical protein IQ03_03741 [Gemmobacter caeni]